MTRTLFDTRHLKAELEFEEYQCIIDRSRSKKRMRELHEQIARLEKAAEDFYNDPMTDYIGF